MICGPTTSSKYLETPRYMNLYKSYTRTPVIIYVLYKMCKVEQSKWNEHDFKYFILFITLYQEHGAFSGADRHYLSALSGCDGSDQRSLFTSCSVTA